MGTGSFKAYPFSVFGAYKGNSVGKQSNEEDVVGGTVFSVTVNGISSA